MGDYRILGSTVVDSIVSLIRNERNAEAFRYVEKGIPCVCWIRERPLPAPGVHGMCRSVGMQCETGRGFRTRGKSAAWEHASGWRRGAFFVSSWMFYA